MNNQENDEKWVEINRSRHTKSDQEILVMVNQNPFVGTYRFKDDGRLLTSMAEAGFIMTVKRLLELGGELQSIEGDAAPLDRAVAQGHHDVAELLLKHGSDPNRHRLLVTASFASEHMNFDQRVAMVQLLIRYGARINDLFPMFDDKSNLRTVLDFVPESFPMFEYLRSLGAKTAKEVLAENPDAFINES
jgi:ankyrin repeat protein